MSISSLFKSLETKLVGVSADAAKLPAAVDNLDKLFQQVMGVAMLADTALTLVDPAIGGPLMAEIAAVKAGEAALKAALPTLLSDASGALAKVLNLLGEVADLAVKLGPFWKAQINDIATIEAAVKAQAATGVVA